MTKEIAFSALILDDETPVLETLKGALEKRGFLAWATQDQESALRFVQTHKPSVACIDLHMPGINGIEVIKKMREMIPDIRVVVVTGHLGTYEEQVKPLNVRIVEKSSRTERELEDVICKELELSKQEFEAIKTREKTRSKARILFVDDDGDAVDCLRDFAVEEGFEAESAHSAAEALQKAEAFKPDILCTDLQMGAMDGDALIKTLKSGGDHASIKVFVGMTGNPTAKNRFVDVGVLEVLDKPFGVTQLINGMKRWAEAATVTR